MSVESGHWSNVHTLKKEFIMAGVKDHVTTVLPTRQYPQTRIALPVAILRISAGLFPA